MEINVCMINNVEECAENLRALFGYPPDFTVRDIKTPFFFGKVVYFDGLIDVKELEESIIEPLIKKGEPFCDNLEGLRSVVSYGGNMKEIEAEKGLNGFEVKKASYTLGYRFSVLCGKTKLYSTICSINEI